MSGDVWAPLPCRPGPPGVRRSPETLAAASVRSRSRKHPESAGSEEALCGTGPPPDIVGRPALAVLPPLSIFKVDLFSRFFFLFSFFFSNLGHPVWGSSSPPTPSLRLLPESREPPFVLFKKCMN